jgi:H+-transporting ATPase
MQTWVMTMMTRKLFVPPFLALGVILFGRFVINPTLMVLLVFATDFATMSLSTDRVTPSSIPERWAVRALVMRSVGLAVLLLLLSGMVFWAASHQWHLNTGESQTLIFAWLVFGSTQATLYAMRTHGFFWEKPYPSRWVLLVTIFDVGVISLLATQGWLMAPVSPALVGSMLLLAILFLLAGGLLKIGARSLERSRPEPPAQQPGN